MASVIVAGARTPFGKFGGGFKDVPATTLAAHAIRAALDRSGVEGKDVDYVIMGQVLQAGAGQITARQAAIGAGIPQEVPAITINKVCLSGINAIALADQLIRAGELEVVVAGGMESMSEAPYVFPRARFGAPMGNAEMVDSMIHDGLWSTFTGQHMGESSDEVNKELEISREEQDAWAARSHQRAARAWSNGGVLKDEVVPFGKLERDEGVRPETTVETLSKLTPAFHKDGTITAGNASQVSDGAAAVDDLDLVEINEAFAAVALNATRMLGLDEEKVNVNGGAVALGHPIGASGARLVLTVAQELKRRGLELGAATLCGGRGQGDALIVR